MTAAERAWAFGWVDAALEAERENAELRRIASSLLSYIFEKEELAAYVEGLIRERAA